MVSTAYMFTITLSLLCSFTIMSPGCSRPPPLFLLVLPPLTIVVSVFPLVLSLVTIVVSVFLLVHCCG